MTRYSARKVQIPGLGILLIAAFTILFDLSATAQVISGGHGASKSTVVSMAPETAKARRDSGGTKGRLGAGPQDTRIHFAPPVTYYAGGQYTLYDVFSVAVADVNGDGKPDLVVINGNGAGNEWDATHGAFSVLLGNGDGTFQPVQTTYLSQSTSYLAIGDVNNDGKPDLVIASCCEPNNDAEVAVLLGNGDGTFQPPVSYDEGGGNAGGLGEGVALIDLNGDGKLDIVTVDYAGAAAVLMGNGDGTFQPVVLYPLFDDATSIVVEDMNHDGKPDLVIPTFPFEAFAVFDGNGNGTFQPFTTYSFNTCGGYSFAVSDVNGDGNPDLVVAGFGPSDCGAEGFISIALGNGDGSFQPPVYYDAGGFLPGSVRVADLNGDGVPDLVVANECGTSQNCQSLDTGTAGVLLGNGDGTFQSPTVFLSGGSAMFASQSLAVADLNGDGLPDLVVTNIVQNTVGVLLNDTGSSTTYTSLSSSGNPCLKPCGVTFTATVTSGAGTPTGTVSFSDDEPRFLGTATLSNGVASVAPGGFHHGTWQITAVYNGSSDFAPSTSPVLYQDVYEQPVPTQTYVSTSGSPSFVGQPVTFSAGVSESRGAVPDGETLNFYDGHELLASVPMSNQGARFTTSSLAVGKHSILVTYNGDGLYEKSHGMVTQIVVKYSTTTTLVSSVNPSVSGQPVTMTVTVTSSGPTPTGVVMLKGFGTLTLVGGTASATKSNFTVGSHSLTAKYKGDDESAASTSEVLIQVVNPD